MNPHPDANEEGYVAMLNINTMQEMRTDGSLTILRRMWPLSMLPRVCGSQRWIWDEVWVNLVLE